MNDDYAIRQLVEKYADAVCRRHKEDWASTWSEDSIWDLSSMPAVSGKDAIVDLWVNAMAGFPYVAQLIQNGTTEVDCYVAKGRWYITEHIQTAENDDDGKPIGFFNIGVYQDLYIKQDVHCLFKERKYAVLYNDNGTGNMTGTVNSYPELVK